MAKNKLLCTYGHYTNLDLILHYIELAYDIPIEYIEPYNTDRDDIVYCFYNIPAGIDLRLENTILMHKKIETNTFFTINAINHIIRECNNGIIDKNYPINWEVYKNNLLLYNDSTLKILQIKIANNLDI